MLLDEESSVLKEHCGTIVDVLYYYASAANFLMRFPYMMTHMFISLPMPHLADFEADLEQANLQFPLAMLQLKPIYLFE